MPTYSLRSHRTGGVAALGVAGLLGGLGAAGLTFASMRDESVDRYQVDATLRGDTLSVVETIDYDFALNSRRGIYRDVDLAVVDRGDQVSLREPSAASASAEDDLEVTEGAGTATLRVGDPGVTFDGVHRYRLGYELQGVPDPTASGRFVYIAVGDRWEVPIDDVSVRVAPDFEPGDVDCSVGGSGSFEDCAATSGDGVVTAEVDRLEPGQGVVLEIGTGSPRTPASLEPPPLELSATGAGGARTTVVAVGLAAAVAGIAGSLLAGRWVRRAGSDRTASAGNPAEAAYATATEGAAISDQDAAEHVTVQFAPPEGLTPPQGAVLEREQTDDAARTAWLAQAVLDGWIELSGDPDRPTISHTEKATRDPSHMPAPLAAMFDGRAEVQLGSYDEAFAAGWRAVGTKLDTWKRTSGLWDREQGARNQRRAAGLLVAGVGAAFVVSIALLMGLGQIRLAAVAAAAVAGLLFGSGLRAVFGVPTLEVRNPAGFGLWLRTEGFRRFLAESEGEHARWAADNGLLREYSAWAVALREVDRWNRAAASAGIAPSDPGLAMTAAFVGLSATAHTTSVAPRSGGGAGGFSGGGFSGGVGGGGGGSW